MITKDGTPTVGQWGRDVQMTPDTMAVRQNLDLIVDGGQPSPASTTTPTGSGARRSATGCSCGAPRSARTPTADHLRLRRRPRRPVAGRADDTAGASGGPDINPSWMSFNCGATSGRSVVGGRHEAPARAAQVGNRYLSDDARDFFAVLRRAPEAGHGATEGRAVTTGSGIGEPLGQAGRIARCRCGRRHRSGRGATLVRPGHRSTPRCSRRTGRRRGPRPGRFPIRTGGCRSAA